MKPALVFAHGWGFHAGIWSQIAAHFSEYDISYWGPEYIRGGPVLSSEIPEDAVVVAYSFGLAQVLVAQPLRPSALVSICGFDSLPKRGREQAVLDLQVGLSRNPNAQMRAFWATCGINRFAESTALNTDELEHGLQNMLQLDAGERLCALTCPVLALASDDDRVVPLEVSAAVWENHALVTSETGGHGLVMTRAPWCVEEIKRFLAAHVS